jgi:hypothetical protein
MASSLISGAIILLLIIIAGYVVASGILTIGETMVLTQTEMTLNQENILQTSIGTPSPDWSSPTLTLEILNTGSTSFKISDSGFDLFLYDSSNTVTRYPSEDLTITIKVDNFNKEMWDQSETLVVKYDPGYDPKKAIFVTPNGVCASTIIP